MKKEIQTVAKYERQTSCGASSSDRPEVTAGSVRAAVESVFAAFVAHDTSGACLIASAIVREIVGTGEVVQGYLTFPEYKLYTRHYWYRHNEIDYDVGSRIRREIVPQMQAVRDILTQSPPDGYTCTAIDPSSRNRLAELEAGYQRYVATPHQFWASAPQWMIDMAFPACT